MLVILPVFAGLLACMPEMAPIGNPERARIDPEITGVWVYSEEDVGSIVFYLEPYDKRTWLLYGVEVENDDESADEPNSFDSYDRLIAGLDAGAAYADTLSIHKAWTAKVGRERFLVWDIKAALRDEGEWGINYAYNWRMTRPDPNRIDLQFINTSHETFADVDHMDRKAVERVIKRHSNAEDFFDEELITLLRADAAHLPLLAELLGEVAGTME